jgi:hypothetical protein
MSNLKNIGNKLFKETTELKSQEVKLGIVDDIESLFDDIMKQSNKIESLSKELRSASIKTAVKIENLRKMRGQAEAKAKELGVDIDTIVAGAMFSRTNNLMKKIQRIKQIRG